MQGSKQKTAEEILEDLVGYPVDYSEVCALRDFSWFCILTTMDPIKD